MTHQISDIAQEFNGKNFFSKARQSYIETPLKELGFRKYKSATVARLTKGNVFQFLNFQKAAYGGQSFNVNVAIRPLFCVNNNYLVLSPGNSLGELSKDYKRDKWWYYRTKEEGDRSFVDVFNQLEKYAIPFFEATETSAEIINASRKNIFGVSKFGDRVSWGILGGRKNFDFGHICLHNGQIDKAIKHFTACNKEFKKDERDWARNIAFESLKINNIIKSGQSHIDQYISDTIRNSKVNLNLIDW